MKVRRIMRRSKTAQVLSVLLSFVLATSFAFPVAAFASEKEIQVDNHSAAQQATLVSDVTIDGVSAPQPGEALDDTATVTTAEGETWDIPVLWLNSNLQVVTQAEEGASYLPVLSFYFPQGIAVEGDGFTVTLSESLTELFGGNEIISIYDASTGITFILPASLRGFFAQNVASSQAADATSVAAEPESEEAKEVAKGQSLIDIYCAQTARDALSDEDLEYLIDLIINRLQPQAVNLLIDSFPAFRTAADNGGIGTQISLYIYYEKGDKDGLAEHEGAPSALAYVAYDVKKRDGEFVYCYMLAVDVDTLLAEENDELAVDPKTGKYKLLREGEGMETLENTLVHETLHAIMDDYNRTGMMGGVRNSDVYTGGSNEFPTKDLKIKYLNTKYPHWFMEGAASAVENDYQYRYDSFKKLRGSTDGGSGYADFYDMEHLVYNYLNAKSNGKDMYYELGFSVGYDASGATVDDEQSRYVSGYLATLYLAELAARKTTGSAVTVTEDTISISSEKLRLGLNSIFERMNKGETLDQVINDISPLGDDGAKRYKDTDAFQERFIKGKEIAEDRYEGDGGTGGSAEFVLQFLNYMLALEKGTGGSAKPNGSILMDFNTFEASPLDKAKEESSDFLKIVESNAFIESTVPSEVALAGGGKSISGTPSSTSSGAKLQAATTGESQTEEGLAPLPIAAKAAVDEVLARAAKVEAADADSCEGVDDVDDADADDANTDAPEDASRELADAIDETADR